MAYADEKTYGSAKYHGMKVGGVHHWTYPDGKWSERKVGPDRWEVAFTSLKRRDRRAPAGSGAETGSGYHWLIVAHQWVEKLDANTYATHLEGSKSLVAFRKPDWPLWDTQLRDAKQHAKEKAIAALQDAIDRIRSGGLDLEDPQDNAALAELAAQAVADSFQLESEQKTAVHPKVPRRKPRRPAMASTAMARTAMTRRAKKEEKADRQRPGGASAAGRLVRHGGVRNPGARGAEPPHRPGPAHDAPAGAKPRRPPRRARRQEPPEAGARPRAWIPRRRSRPRRPSAGVGTSARARGGRWRPRWTATRRWRR